MTDNVRTPGEQPLDVATLTADELLLDALGQGELPDGPDDVAAMLAAWRSELDSDPAWSGEPGMEPDPDGDVDRDPEVERGQPALAPVTAIRRRMSKPARLLLTAAAALAVAGGLTVAAASQAGPGSLLWPITRIAFPDHADVAAAQQAIDMARKAADEGRYEEAWRLVDRATALIARVRSPQDARRLRTELDQVRHLLTAVSPDAGPTVPGSTSSPPATSGAPGGAPGTGPGGGPGGAPGGGSGDSPGGGGPVGGGGPGVPLPTGPGLPPVPPLPSLPALPSVPPLPLPTTLPSLPVPGLAG